MSGHPMEVWAYLVDCDGAKLTEEQHVVLAPGGGEEGMVGAALERTFEALDGMEDREPVAIEMRFVDGHVARGEMPPGSWDKVQWEEDEEEED